MLKKLNNIKEDDDYTLEIKRLYDVWNEAGRPTISNDKSIINYIPSNEYRPNYNNILNKIYRVNNTNDVVSELAHPIQVKNGNRNNWYNYVVDGIETIYNEIQGKTNQYDNKNHFENETHDIIEPELINYIINNTPTKYIPKSNKKSLGGIY